MCSSEILSKAVIQMTKSGDFITEHYSMSHASRLTGVYISNISACCKGIVKTAGGFKWALLGIKVLSINCGEKE